MRTVLIKSLTFLGLLLGISIQGQTADVATIRPEVRTGFAHAGWKYDRYTDMPSLDAGRRMILAELAGPGIIRRLHVTRHQEERLTSRGIVLEITFDGADTPETFFTRSPAWHAAVARNGCWIDYATVHYWYQTIPGGFGHRPLRPVAEQVITALIGRGDPI